MSTDLTSISWPVVIRHRGDPELTYIVDADQWLNDEDLSAWRYDDGDMLIDSDGACYSLAFDDALSITTPNSMDMHMPLSEFSILIQQHLFALAQTCVSKVECRDYADGFSTLEKLDH